MGGKRKGRNPIPEWAKEGFPPAGVVVKVYRHSQDSKESPEYLGKIGPDHQVDLDSLVKAHATELDSLIPNVETKRLWGGGKYEFRFFWRDEEGREEQKRSRIGYIDGRPLPKR